MLSTRELKSLSPERRWKAWRGGTQQEASSQLGLKIERGGKPSLQGDDDRKDGWMSPQGWPRFDGGEC